MTGLSFDLPVWPELIYAAMSLAILAGGIWLAFRLIRGGRGD